MISSRLSNYRFPEVIACFQNGAFTPEKLCTHKIHYGDMEESFREIKEHPPNVCKILVSFS